MRKLSISILIIYSLYIYRTELFNLCVTYQQTSEISVEMLTDEYWTTEVDKILSSSGYQGVEEYNDLIVKLISSKLNFGSEQKENNPNDFRESTAHCVGYSSLHASLLNYSFKKSSYIATHVRGDIYLFGFQLTDKLQSSFFKDHDFVRIENPASGRYFYTDASVYEFTRVSRVAFSYGI